MKLILSIAVMAIITYIIRALPLTVFKRDIKSPFLRSFLYYIPYSVLSAMTFPAILYSTQNIYCAAAGLCVALVLAFFNKGLFITAISAAAAVFLVQLLF